MFKKLHITCDKATTICDKNQYNEASFFEKIQLNWHLFICKICSNYSKQNSLMTQIFHIRKTDCNSKKACMSESEKDLLKRKFEKVKD